MSRRRVAICTAVITWCFPSDGPYSYIRLSAFISDTIAALDVQHLVNRASANTSSQALRVAALTSRFISPSFAKLGLPRSISERGSSNIHKHWGYLYTFIMFLNSHLSHSKSRLKNQISVGRNLKSVLLRP